MNDPETRRSYTREYKISVLKWQRDNGCSTNKTAKHFNISRRNIIRWIGANETIHTSKKGTKSIGSGRSAMYPALESQLHEEFLELRNKGAKIRNMWFMAR